MFLLTSFFDLFFIYPEDIIVKKIVVVGAGIVGMSCAVALRQKGHQVTVVDPELPGSQCSFGNAGSLNGNAHFPSMAMLPKIPGMLLNPLEPLSIIWRDFPQMLPWFVRYLMHSRPSRTQAIALAAASLNARVQSSMTDLLASVGAMDMLHWGGRMFAYRDQAGMAGDEPLMKLKFQAGIEMKKLTGDEARDMEPALGPLVDCAIFTPDAGHVVNPYRVVTVLADWMAGNGGTFSREKVVGFERQGMKVTGAVTSAGRIDADEFIIASGAWSAKLAYMLGVRIPLIAERGYHAMVASPGVTLTMPTMWMDRKIMVSPMEHGIRIAGLSEFGGADRSPNFEKMGHMLSSAQELLPAINLNQHQPWMGPRPATPDYLPVIGRSKALENVAFACGHGHSGLMFGPVTGKLVASVIGGEAPGLDMKPFSPDRFGLFS